MAEELAARMGLWTGALLWKDPSRARQSETLRLDW